MGHAQAFGSDVRQFNQIRMPVLMKQYTDPTLLLGRAHS